MAQSGDRTVPVGLDPVDPSQLEGLEIVQITRAYIPDAVDLSERLPLPGDQGDIGSCVSWATAYAARSYYSFIESSTQRSDNTHIASPAYLHDKIRNMKKPCDDSGSHILLALKYLSVQGVPSFAEVGTDAMCKPRAVSNASPALGFKIRKPVVVFFRRPNDKTTAPASVVDKIKQQLANGNPVLFSMIVDKRMMRLAGAEIYNAHLGASDEAVGADNGKRGAHAMVLVGYDDRRQSFRILNSWGRSWSDGGYGWVSYDSIRTDMLDAWVMDVGIKPPKPTASRPTLQGKSDLKVECGDIRMREDKGAVVVQGFVPSDEEKKRIEKLASAVSDKKDDFSIHIDVRPWPVCEALLTLAEPLSAASLPKLTATSGKTTLHFNDTLGLTVTSPDFPSFLYLVYLQADGKAVNLLPRRGAIRQQTAPGTVITFGNGEQGRARFRVSPPSGTEAVVAIAARSPLAELEALESDGAIYKVAAAAKNPIDQAESPPDRAFLSALRSGLLSRPDPAALQREVAAAVLHLSIEP
jgi:hypothetical protein